MASIAINYAAPPIVWRFMQARDFLDLIVGPVGSGKSSGCCIKAGLVLPMEMPCAGGTNIRRSRGAIVRNTYPELRETTIKTFFEWIPRDLGEWKESTHTFLMDYPVGDGTRVNCEILFKALDRPDNVRDLLSLELTWAYFNEWREISKSITEAMQHRIGRFPRKDDVPRYYSGLFGDTNAFDTDHYLYKLFKEPDPDTGRMLEGYKIFEQPGGLDPKAENVEHLDRCFDPTPEELEHLAVRLGGLPPRSPEVMAEARRIQGERIEAGEHESPCRCYYRRMMRGKRRSWIDCYVHSKYVFATDGRPIYEEFNDHIHVGEFDHRNVKTIYIGNDYGLTPAAVFGHVMPDGQLRISHEFVSERMGALHFGQEQARLARREWPGARFQGWGDPAGMAASPTDEEKTPISVVNGCGVPMDPAPTNEWTIRRDAVALGLTTLTMAGQPEILIHPRCKWLVKAMAGGYCLKRKQVSGDEQYRDQPDKENPYSHVAEALQYLVVGLGRDRRVLEGGADLPEGVQSPPVVRRAVSGMPSGSPDRGDGVQVRVRRALSRR